jgi:hypothetical protein
MHARLADLSGTLQPLRTTVLAFIEAARPTEANMLESRMLSSDSVNAHSL